MKKTSYKKIYWTIAILAVFLLLTTAYYLINLKKLDRRTEIIGDALCGNLAEKEGQDFCCTRAHKSDVVIQCVGNWQFNQETKYCEYLCRQESCAKDLRVCPNGETVSRNASNNCQFDSCD